MEKFKKLLALSFCLVVLTAVFSCKKDKDDNNRSHDVEFKVSTSANANISTVIHTNVQGDPTSITSVGGSSWSTKLTVQPGVPAISLGANATATDATGTMKIQILVDGVVVKENTASGQVLSATTVYYTNAD